MSHPELGLRREKLPARLQGWLDAALEGDAIREDVRAFAELWDVLAGSVEYRRFLARHFWAVDALWRGLRSSPGGRLVLGPAFRYRCYCFPLDLFLDLLIASERRGWRELMRLAEIVVHRPYLFQFEEDAECHRLCLELAEGDPARFEKLFEVKKTRPLWSHAAEAQAGWRFLERSAAARRCLASCAEREDLRPRVLRVLERVALAVQIQLREQLRRILRQWERPAPASGLALPASLPEDLKRTLAELAAYRRLADERDDVPDSVRKILERPETMRRELAVLERKQAEGILPRGAAARMRNLREYLANPAGLAEWVAEEARPACQAEAPRVRLRALERQLDDAMRAKWQTVLGRRRVPPDDPGWDHALRLHHQATCNRRLLKALLRQVLEEGRGWPLEHPRNAAFEEKMRLAGVDVDAWKSPLRHEFRLRCEGREAYAENDPLRMFEARGLFGAGAGAGRDNSFATIAEAAEADKRVLYLKNQRGAILGRKLIGLAPGAEVGALLIGFRSHGARGTERPVSRASGWVKVLFDVFCHEIALRTGTRLAGPNDDIGKLCESLGLFAKWRADGVEPFDEWVIEAGAGGSLATFGAIRRVSEALLQLQHPKQRAALARGLLWLGVYALPLLEQIDLEALGPEALGFLRRYTTSIDVRRWVSRRI